jgi:hypothetical protein
MNLDRFATRNGIAGYILQVPDGRFVLTGASGDGGYTGSRSPPARG